MWGIAVAEAAIPLRAFAADNDLAGTYKLVVEQRKILATTKQVRTVTRDGARLVYTTPPLHFHTDGKMSVNTLIREKVKNP